MPLTRQQGHPKPPARLLAPPPGNTLPFSVAGVHLVGKDKRRCAKGQRSEDNTARKGVRPGWVIVTAVYFGSLYSERPHIALCSKPQRWLGWRLKTTCEGPSPRLLRRTGREKKGQGGGKGVRGGR